MPSDINPSLSEQSVDLQTVDRWHVPEAVGDGVVSVGGTVRDRQGLNSTVLDSERQPQLPHTSTTQRRPLTQGSSGDGGDGGVQLQPNTAQHCRDIQHWTDIGVEG